MDNRLQLIGLIIAFLALLVAVLAWLVPFSPINPSPITGQKAPTLIPYDTPLEGGSGETVDDEPTAKIIESFTTALQETAQVPTQILSPRIYNFSACKDPCNGANSTTIFPSAITKIYVEWDYEGIPYGAHYVRKWTMNGREWIKYDCNWTGSENGKDSVKLTEPKGFHSGTWQVTITVDRNILLSEQINVSGNWDYWDPAGTLNRCYGTTD